MNLTTKQAAESTGLSEQRIRALIKEGKLSAEKFGKAHLIRAEDLATVTVHGKAGRPTKIT